MKKPWRWKRTLLKAILIFALALMLFRWFEHSQVYHPTRDWVVEPSTLG